MVASSVVRVVLVGKPEPLLSEVQLALPVLGFKVFVVEGFEDLERQVAQYQPDALLLAFDALQRPAQVLLGRLSQCWPVLLLATQGGSSNVVQAMRSGVTGYLLRESLRQELPLALRTVLEGYRYLSPRVSGPLLDLAVGGPVADRHLLTERQKEVLYWLAQGHCTKEIAFLMNLSIKTVNAHKIRLKERLGIHDLAGLVLYALRQGIIDLPA